MRSWVHVEDLLESIQQGGDLMEMLAIIIIKIMKQRHLYTVSHTLTRATGEEMF